MRAPAATGPSSVTSSACSAAFIRFVAARMRKITYSSESIIGSSFARLFSNPAARSRCSRISMCSLLSGTLDELELGERALQIVVLRLQIAGAILAQKRRVVPLIGFDVALPLGLVEK